MSTSTNPDQIPTNRQSIESLPPPYGQLSTSSANPNQPKTFNPPSVPQPPPTYNQVAITPILPHSKLITLAGQIGMDPKTGRLHDDFRSQVRQAYTNLDNCLREAGAAPRDIVHVRHYIVNNPQIHGNSGVVDRGWAPLWVKYMDEKASGHRPPDTVLGVASLATSGILYEVEAWAILNEC